MFFSKEKLKISIEYASLTSKLLPTLVGYTLNFRLENVFLFDFGTFRLKIAENQPINTILHVQLRLSLSDSLCRC